MNINGVNFSQRVGMNTLLPKSRARSPLDPTNIKNRFDRLELSDVFKKLEAGSAGDVDKLRKMLSANTGNETVKKLYSGAFSYSKMDISLSLAEHQSKACKFMLESYAEDKARYKDILGSEGLSDTDRANTETALADVQSRIDKLIGDLNKKSPRISRDEFNSCAENLNKSLGINGMALTEKQYDTMFGNTEYTEENAIEKLTERIDALTGYHKTLMEKMDECVRNIRDSLTPKDRALVPVLLKLSYNDAFDDLMAGR